MSFLCRLRCIGCLRPVQIARFLSSSEASSTNEPQFAELFDELVNQNVQKVSDIVLNIYALCLGNKLCQTVQNE